MHLPNGSQIFVENTRDVEVAVTKLTNNKNPVATVADGTKFKAGDYALVTFSSWAALTNRVVRIKSVATNDLTIEGFDSSDTNKYPAGATASIAKILTWVEIPCVQDLAQEGGEQQFYNYQCLADDREQQLPTFKSAVSLTYTFAHEYDNPIYPVLSKAEDSGEVKALRMFIPKAKEMRMYSGVLSFNDIPQTTMNEMETVSLAVALKGKFESVPAEAV